MKITLEMLKKHGACAIALNEFQRIFGEEAEVTPENAEKALESQYLLENVFFLIRTFLTQAGVDKWHKLNDSFEHAYDENGDCQACRMGMLTFVQAANDGGWNKDA